MSVEMEVSVSCNAYDDETRALERLLDIFGSALSLREIASAFCKAGRNFEMAADILSESNECSSSASLSHMSNGKAQAVDLSEQLSENISKICEDAYCKPVKPKKHSAAVGTVSSVIGREYAKPKTLSAGLSQVDKPLKVNLSEFAVAEIQKDDVLLDSMTKKDPINSDVEVFLFKMLGEGFQLGMDVIHDVLGSCGYDANKGIEKLIDLSASTLKRSDDIVVGDSAEKSAETDAKKKFPSRGKKLQDALYSERNKTNLSRDVLTSLFGAPDRCEEPPRKSRPVRAVKKRRSYGPIVSEPLTDRNPALVTDLVDIQMDINDDVEEEDNYQFLRRVAKEHWVTMKEYYKAAFDAFAKGNQALADELLQQGQFFGNKAREADERSSQKIFECSTKETADVVSSDDVILDLHDHDGKRAINLLKLHLTNLASIGSFQNLKVILESAGEDTTKSSRRRRVLKLLQQESIKWTEEDGTITIQLGEIDPDELSFANKGGKEGAEIM